MKKTELVEYQWAWNKIGEMMMEKLIDINSYPVSVVLKAFSKDKTTGKNIIFATSAYTENGRTINEKEYIYMKESDNDETKNK